MSGQQAQAACPAIPCSARRGAPCCRPSPVHACGASPMHVPLQLPAAAGTPLAAKLPRGQRTPSLLKNRRGRCRTCTCARGAGRDSSRVG